MKYFEKTSEAVKVEVKQRSTSSNKGTTYSSKNKQSSKSFRSKSDKKSYSEKGGKSGSMHIFQHRDKKTNAKNTSITLSDKKGRKVSATDHKDYDKGERTTSVRKKGRFGRTKTVEKTTMMKSSAFFDEFVQILK